ncbi:8529_t:CDS:1, partial [Racocetra persica]
SNESDELKKIKVKNLAVTNDKTIENNLDDGAKKKKNKEMAHDK